MALNSFGGFWLDFEMRLTMAEDGGLCVLGLGGEMTEIKDVERLRQVWECFCKDQHHIGA